MFQADIDKADLLLEDKSVGKSTYVLSGGKKSGRSLFRDNIHIESAKNHDIMGKNIGKPIGSGKGKSSMRDYSNMTDEEFIKAYETPYTQAEIDEEDRIVKTQIAEGKVQEFTDELIDEIFADDGI